MITLTEKEQKTLEVLGKRFKNKEPQTEVEKVNPFKKDGVENIFISTGGCDDSFAFRGINTEKEKWCENPKLYHYCPR